MGVRPVIKARWRKRVLLVDNPMHADVVLWLIWEYALCVASGFTVRRVEKSRLFVQQSCEANLRLLRWLAETPRWKMKRGVDHGILALYPGGRHGDLLWEREDVPAGVFQSAIILTKEDRRGTFRVGNSYVLAVPYYCHVPRYLPPPKNTRHWLIGFWGSLGRGRHCEKCKNHTDPVRLRQRMIEHLERECHPEECLVYVNETAQKLSKASETMITTLWDSLFCLLPRGDSAATKRFFAAVIAGCIPVVISDLIPLPFSRRIRYESIMVRITEARMMLKAFSLVNYLRRMPEQRIQSMRREMVRVRHSLWYSHGCASTRNGMGVFKVDKQSQLPWRVCAQNQESMPDAVDSVVRDILRVAPYRKTPS